METITVEVIRGPNKGEVGELIMPWPSEQGKKHLIECFNSEPGFHYSYNIFEAAENFKRL